MNVKKIVFVIAFLGIFAGGFFVNTQPAQAATVEELMALIAQLKAQILQLQQQLATTQGQPAEWCHDFNTNIRLGDSGDEVYALQTALLKEGLLGEGDTSDKTFGEQTASAVVGFQQKYKSEILTPFGLKFGTGFVGKGTRAKLNALYECGVTQPTAIVPFPTPTLPPTTPPPIRPPVFPPSIPSITVLSPNGGETLQKGSTTYINLKFSPSVPLGGFVINLLESNADVAVSHLKECGTGQVTQDSVVLPNVSFQWKVGYNSDGKEISIGLSGSYRVLVYDCGSKIDNVWTGSSVTAKSNVFSIVSAATSTQPFITVLFPNGGNQLQKGTAPAITWNSNHASGVYIKLRKGADTYQGIEGKVTDIIPNTGSYQWLIPTTLPDGNDYSIRVIDSAGSIFDDSDAPFSIVSSTGTADLPDFVIENVTLPSSVLVNQEAVVTFSVINRGNGTFLWEKYRHGVPWKVAGGETAQRLISDGCYTSVNIVPGAGCQVSVGLTYTTPGTPMWVLMNVDPDNKIAETNKSNNSANKSFTVSAATASPSITVLSPNGGEAWTVGSSYVVKWSTLNIPKDQNASLNLIDSKSIVGLNATNVNANDGVATITVPAGVVPGLYRVVVTVPYPAKYTSDESDGYITVVSAAATPSITVLSPNGGENWVFGNTYTITWKSSGVETAYVYLQFSDGAMCKITQGYALYGNIGFAPQKDMQCSGISRTLTAGQYKVAIYGESETVKDFSDNYFTIVSAASSLKNIEDQTASISDAISKLLESFREFKKSNP